MKEYLKNLNKSQYEAATTINGNLLMIAGAGTGKTATLVARVCHMLDNGIKPENILLLTFTNKSAKEMKQRIKNAVGPISEKITASTFHSFCLNTLYKNPNIYEDFHDFSIIDSTDSQSIVSMAVEVFLEYKKRNGVEYDLKKFPSTKLISYYMSEAINTCVELDSIVNEFNCPEYFEEIRTIIDISKRYKEDHKLIDYDDLLDIFYKILKNNKEFRKKINSIYKFISCDEYQDTNIIQDNILNYISEDNGNLAVVGDDNQSIYAFRFANIYNILDFTKKYKDCKTIILDQNYRSSQEILDLSNYIMKYAQEGIPKTLKSNRHGERPNIVIFDNEWDEANKLAQEICNRYYNGECLNDIAVITRSAAQTFKLEIALSNLDIPFKKFGGKRFVEKPAVKDVLSFLRVSVNQKDELALFRALQLFPKVGKGTAKKMADYILKNGLIGFEKKFSNASIKDASAQIKDCLNRIKDMDLKEIVPYIVNDFYPLLCENEINNKKIADGKKSELLKKLKIKNDEISVLIELSQNWSTTKDFLDALILDAAIEETKNDFLNITTIHSAKGLEYKTVYILDVIENVTPRTKKGDDDDNEELRCFYVALTRAKNELYLLCPQRYLNNESKLSHFIDHDELLKYVNVTDFN